MQTQRPEMPTYYQVPIRLRVATAGRARKTEAFALCTSDLLCFAFIFRVSS